MKLNIQVELDWLEEDGGIEQRVQDEIISGVKNAISKDCLDLVKDKTKEAIDTGLTEATAHLKDKVSEFFENWLDNEAVVTDKFGDPTEKGTLKDIIKREFNDCMNQRVDAKGNRSDGYGAKYTRLEFVTGAKVKEVVDDSLARYNAEIEKTIKATIDAGIKQRVSDKFAEMVIGYARQDFENAKAIEHKG